MDRKLGSEAQILKLIARCLRQVHRLGDRCNDCLPVALERLEPPQQRCNWQAVRQPCEFEECELELTEAVEEIRHAYDVDWPRQEET